MSPRKSDDYDGGSENPPPDIYVGLLFVAAAALVTGCIFLVVELNKYEWTVPT